MIVYFEESLEMSQTRDSAHADDFETKKRKKKLTKHIGIMVQNGGGIGRVVSARCARRNCDRLGRPTFLGGIVNVNRIWVGSVRIENVDGVCELTPHNEHIEHAKRE